MSKANEKKANKKNKEAPSSKEDQISSAVDSQKKKENFLSSSGSEDEAKKAPRKIPDPVKKIKTEPKKNPVELSTEPVQNYSFEDSEDDPKPSKVIVASLPEHVEASVLESGLLEYDPEIAVWSLPAWRSNFGKLDVKHAIQNTYIPEELAQSNFFYMIASKRNIDVGLLSEALSTLELDFTLHKAKKFLEHKQIIQNEIASRQRGQTKAMRAQAKNWTSSEVSKKSVVDTNPTIAPFGQTSNPAPSEGLTIRDIAQELTFIKQSIATLQADYLRLSQMGFHSHYPFYPGLGGRPPLFPSNLQGNKPSGAFSEQNE